MEHNQFIEPEGITKDTLEVNIVSAEDHIYSGRARMLSVTGEEGELGIFPGHAQLLTSIKPGEVRLITLDNKENYYYVSGGFMEVQPEIVTILADTVIRAEDIDEQRAIEAKKHAEEAIAGAKKIDDYYNTMMLELAKAIAQLRVAKRRL